MGLTAAERQKRYRERQKERLKTDPELKKKMAEKATLYSRYYREKLSQYVDEEMEKRRQQWREAEGKWTSTNKTKVGLTPAEKQKRYRERLKENPDKYEEYRKKAAAKASLYYREKVSQLTDEEKEKRRQQWRDANRNQTLAKKEMPLTPDGGEVQEKRKIEGREKHEEIIKNMEHSTYYNGTENVSQTTQNEAQQQVKRRLTSAERQRRYREKLKKENPDKYEEYKKKSAAKALLYYREKVSQLTEEEKEKRRQQWRYANRNQTLAKKQMPLTPDGGEVQEKREMQDHEKHAEIINNMEHTKCSKGTANISQTTQNEEKKQVKRRLTSAERTRRYREKLKKQNPDKYEEYRRKNAAKALRYYREKVRQKRQWNDVRGKILSPAERMKRYRERLKRENPAKYEDLLKKSAEASKRYYREKAKLYTEEEKEERRQKWREARRMHKKQSSRRKQKQHEMIDEESSSEDAHPGPSEPLITPPWGPDSLSVSDNSQRDPLCKLTDQCRFCGKDSEECLIVSNHMPYLSGNSTTLALNDISVQLDFNDGLPNNVCISCNTKLHEFSEFIKSVKVAQETMKRKIKTEPEGVREVDIIVKTEPTDIFEDNSISISETVFVKKTYKRKAGETNHKKAKFAKNVIKADETKHKEKAKFAKNVRKADETKHKKAKFAKKVMVESENRMVIDIKEEIVDEQIQSRLSDASSDTLSMPSELETTVSSVIDETLAKKEAESDNTRVIVPEIVSGMIICLGPSTSSEPNDALKFI